MSKKVSRQEKVFLHVIIGNKWEMYGLKLFYGNRKRSFHGKCSKRTKSVRLLLFFKSQAHAPGLFVWHDNTKLLEKRRQAISLTGHESLPQGSQQKRCRSFPRHSSFPCRRRCRSCAPWCKPSIPEAVCRRYQGRSGCRS